ncbi:cation diffusion facilitator family transporter [Cloacibacterium sp.]|uniref:cation diffusion facilitator family transporter n=1 Tax=Cloacibacterium sp. TaxID=1913682 RepID=UPI0035AE8C75
MSHSHDHGHSHVPALDLNSKKLRNAFYIGIFLNVVFVVIEAVVGWRQNSLALLSDAGHNLSDVVSLVLSLIAFKLMYSKATQSYTYGYKKVTVLVALFNALLLFAAVGGIIYEAIFRFYNPQPLQGKTMAIVAFVGIIINSVTAYFFMKDKDADLNVKGAYLHMAADALVSLGVVIAGVVIIFTNWFWLDAVMSIVIALVILYGTWSLFTQSLKLALDGVPEGVDFNKLKEEILGIDGVKDFKHLHIWALSTTENALTAHLKVEKSLSLDEIETLKDKVKYELEHFNVQHITLEIYFNDREFKEEEML